MRPPQIKSLLPEKIFTQKILQNAQYAYSSERLYMLWRAYIRSSGKIPQVLCHIYITNHIQKKNFVTPREHDAALKYNQ